MSHPHAPIDHHKGFAENGVCFGLVVSALLLVAVGLQWLLQLTM